jgi:hypothetical protein
MYWFNRQRTVLLASMKTAPSVEPYLTFQSVNSFTISVASPKWDGTMEYSHDTENWTTWNGSAISSVEGKIYLRGTGNTSISSDSSGNYSQFVISGTAVECVGNIETLLDWQSVVDGQHPTMSSRCFSSAFMDCIALIKAPDLPATNLAIYCYSDMFRGCTALTTAPALPANNLVIYCYSDMFRGCTALTTAPALPANNLANYCYAYMFYDCTALTTAPALPANNLAKSCYTSMFRNCTSLKISTTQSGIYQYAWRIPTSGTISSTPSSWNTNMFAETGGTFTSNPTINTTYYVENQPVSS